MKRHRLTFIPLKNLSIARTDLIRFMDGYVSSMKPEKTSGILHSKIHSIKQNRWDLCSKSFGFLVRQIGFVK